MACQPDVPEEEIDRLLHIVIVGGGPTGVEFGAELYDFFKTVRYKMIAYEIQLRYVTLQRSNVIFRNVLYETRLVS